MDEKMRKIKEIRRWLKTFPTVYESDREVHKYINYLLSECERLERDKDLKDYRKRDLLIEQLSTRVVELEEGIEKYLDDPEFDTEILTKLIEKEKP